MLNNQDGPFGFEPLPGANAQERQQAAREQWRQEEERWRQEEERWRQEEERWRQEEERRRQQEEWARQARENQLEERMRVVAQHDRDEYRSPSAAGSLFEFLRHHWAVFREQTSGAARPGKQRR
ncbi:MAG TPA: hypothetical protein P5032_13045 [Candidatus Competibacter sp.]|nr:hypothetical protein [Candidatus Competibacter sp.]